MHQKQPPAKVAVSAGAPVRAGWATVAASPRVPTVPRALGAKVEPARKEIGWYSVTLTDAAAHDPIWRDVDQEIAVFHWHGDAFELPRGAVPLASSALTPHQAFRHGRASYGLLFHMEMD